MTAVRAVQHAARPRARVRPTNKPQKAASSKSVKEYKTQLIDEMILNTKTPLTSPQITNAVGWFGPPESPWKFISSRLVRLKQDKMVVMYAFSFNKKKHWYWAPKAIEAECTANLLANYPNTKIRLNGKLIRNMKQPAPQRKRKVS